MRTVSNLTPRRSVTAALLLFALGVFVSSGCTKPMDSAVSTDAKRKPFFDWFGLSKTDSTAQAETPFDPTGPSPLNQPKSHVALSKETKDLMKRLDAELRRYKVPETERDEIVRRLMRNRPKHIVDALNNAR